MSPLASIAGLQRKVAGVLRAGDWWEHKVPCFLGVAYAFAYHEQLSFPVFWPLILTIIVAAISCAGYVSVINDLTDLELDARVGKPNKMLGRSAWFRAGALGFCLLLGTCAGWLMRGCPVALVIFALDWLVFTLYSVPPFRLKCRGGWGVLADALGGQFLPTLLMAVLIAESTHHELEWFLAVPLVLWGLAFGLRGILGHQLRDREADRAAKIKTMVTRRGDTFISRLVVWVIYPVEAFAFLWLLVVFNAPLTWPLLALCLLIELRRGKWEHLRATWRAPAPDYWLPLIDYYMVYFPATFILALAWGQPVMLLLLVMHVVFFPGCNRQAAYAVAGLLLAPFRGGYLAWHTGVPQKK